jgi:multiple sugar transport system substrate-binding protein
MATSVRRKAAAGLLAIGTLLSVVACGAGEPDDESSPLEVWARVSGGAAAAYERIFDEYTAQTGVEIDFKAVAELDTQIQALAQQKKLPDVWINDAGSLGNYVAQGFLLPVDPARIEGAENIPQSTWDENLGTDGEIYGVPFSRQAVVTFVRKDWRENLGYDIPKTWDELHDLAVAFAEEDPDGNGKNDTYGMIVPGSAQSGYIYRWMNPYILQAGGDALTNNEDGTFSVAFDSPEVRDAAEWAREQFCTDGAIVPGSIGMTTADSSFFETGEAGIYATGIYNLNTFDIAVGPENVEIIPKPAGPAGTTSWAEGEDIYFGAASDRMDEKERLASFLISETAQTIGMEAGVDVDGTTTQAVVRIPVNQNVDGVEVTGDERYQIAMDAYADAVPFPWSINFLPYRQIIADGLNAMMSSCGSDIDAGIAQIASDLQAQLETDGIAG